MPSVPSDVERNAPRLSLHPAEAYPPVRADDWLEASSLYWYEGKKRELAFEPARELFAGPAGGDFRHRGRRLAEITRPWQSGRPKSERASGFALSTGSEPEPVSASSEPVPVYYEHVAGQYVTYWIYHAWSTVPRKIPGPGDLGFETAMIEDEQAMSEAEAALLETYPELVRAATPAGTQLMALGDAVRWVRNWLGKRWPVLHEGDWEGLSVSLARGRTRDVAYFQHGKPQELTVNADVRPRLYVANGSHASYPDLDPNSPGSPRVKAIEQLAEGDVREIELIDVRSQPWYGFGGAWGAAGETSDETGPLGPGDSKGPRPFADESRLRTLPR